LGHNLAVGEPIILEVRMQGTVTYRRGMGSCSMQLGRLVHCKTFHGAAGVAFGP